MERDNPSEPDEWFAAQRTFPYGKTDANARRQAIEWLRNARMTQASTRNANWILTGPGATGGRITDLEMPSGNTTKIYAGTATGGIFRSNNLGNTWAPIFDNQSSLSIGDIAIAPSNNNLLYVGTGEPNAGGGSLAYDGTGIYKSIDGGNSWQPGGLENCGSTGRIAIDPSDPNRVFAAMMGDLFADGPDRGIYRTLDGGNSWQKVLGVSDSTGGIDVVIDPQQPQIVYASMWERVRRPDRRSYGGLSSGIYKSTDGGNSWNKLLGNGVLPVDPGRINLSLCDAQPNVLYASVIDKEGFILDIYKTTDGGVNWTALGAVGNADIFPSGYDWWMGGVKVDPTNPDNVYALMLFAYKSTDGGVHWNQILEETHVDYHAFFFSKSDPGLVLLGSDGGFYRSQNYLQTVSPIGQKLPITQFYSCDVNPLDTSDVMGGAQDNYCIRRLPDSINWTPISYGDGLVVHYHPTEDYIFTSSQYGGLGFYDHGAYYEPSGFQADRFNWKTPYVLNPQHPSSMYFGANRLYKSEDYGYHVFPISPDLTGGPGQVPVVYGTITAIAVAPSDSNYIYVGTDDAHVWRSKDGGNNWIPIQSGLPQRWVTSIAVDDLDPEAVYITFSGYRFNDPMAHVYHSENAGDDWTDMSGDLPDVPVNDILIDPEMPNTFYLATDVGVMTSNDAGSHWALTGTGMPVLVVTDLCLHQPTRTLYAATYGRSMYQLSLPPLIATHEPAAQADISVFPNPFSVESNIAIGSLGHAAGELEIWDGKGNLLKRFGLVQPGSTVRWAGDNDSGGKVPPGVYFVAFRKKEGLVTRKVIRY